MPVLETLTVMRVNLIGDGSEDLAEGGGAGAPPPSVMAEMPEVVSETGLSGEFRHEIIFSYPGTPVEGHKSPRFYPIEDVNVVDVVISVDEPGDLETEIEIWMNGEILEDAWDGRPARFYIGGEYSEVIFDTYLFEMQLDQDYIQAVCTSAGDGQNICVQMRLEWVDAGTTGGGDGGD